MSALWSSLLTWATALGVAMVLLPACRAVFVSARIGGALRLRRNASTRAGVLGILLAVLCLLPMGGDGFVVDWGDARLAVGLLLATALAIVALSRDYRALDMRRRLALQGLFAVTAVCTGLQPAGVSPPIVACGVGALLVVACANALRTLDGLEGLAPGTAAIVAACFAVVAEHAGLPEWRDLSLALCGALLALLPFSCTRGPHRIALGDPGCLVVGFLLGLVLLRVSGGVAPGTRHALGIPWALPALHAAWLAARALWPQRLARSSERFYEVLLDAGIPAWRSRFLLWLATAVLSLLSLRLLHVLP